MSALVDISLPQQFVIVCQNEVLAPHNVGLLVGPPAQDRAASRQPITIDLGTCGLPQPGDGFVTPSLHGAVAQGNCKTPPSGEWVTYENAASGNRMHQVLPVSVETLTILEMVLDVFWHI